MALNIKLADAYVDLSMRTHQFDSAYAKILSNLRNVPTLKVGINVDSTRFRTQMVGVRNELAKLQRYTIQLRVDRSRATSDLSLLRQQLQTIQRTAGTTIAVRADLRQWNRAIAQVHMDLHRVKLAANIPIRANTSRAHANLNLLLQQLHTIQAQSKFTFTGQKGGWWPSAKGIGGGGFGGGAGGPGFASGLWTGAGLPYAANPQMMAGELVSKAVIGSIQTAADLETGFAELRRITGQTAEQMDQFKSSLMELATSRPGVSTADLISMAQIGGRMGVVDKGGMQGLKEFTEQLSRVKLAIPDMETENLANQISRTLNVFDLGTDRIAGFGSALVAMDNMSTASASDILNITQRLSGFAKSANMTLPQVVALASVLKDVGLTNEVAGSAISRILSKITTKWSEVAETVGLDAAKFKDAIQRDPLEALQMVIEKFGEMKDTIGKQGFLADINIKNSRDLAAFQQLYPKFGEVARRAKIAAQETGTTASLGSAESIMGATTEGDFQKAKNSVVDLADAAGSRLTPIARVAAGVLGDIASGLASIVRGTNQTSFAAPGEAAKKALDALPDKNRKGPEPEKPKTLEDAQAAVDAATKKRDDAEAEAKALNGRVAQEGFAAREQMRQAGANPALFDQANAAIGQVEALKAKAAAAKETAGQAAQELVAAKGNLQEVQADEAKKQAGFDRENKILDIKNRVGGVLGAVGDARQRLLGFGVRAVGGAIDAVMPEGTKKAEGPRPIAAVGSNTLEAGRRIQEEILRSKPEEAATKTEKNTRDAVGLLGELRDILKGGAGQIGAAALAR